MDKLWAHCSQPRNTGFCPQVEELNERIAPAILASPTGDIVAEPPAVLIGQTDPAPGTPSSTYDANGNLLSQTDEAGNTTTYTYYGNGILRSDQTTDPAGQVLYSESYDRAGNLLNTTDADGNTTTYTYYGEGNVRSVQTTDPAGQALYSENYDHNGNLVNSTDAAGNTTSYTYNADGGLLSDTTTDAAGQVLSSNSYDGHGYPLRATDADGNTTVWTYDANGILQSDVTTDAAGQVIYRESYDSNGYLLSQTDADGNTTSYTYDANGYLVGDTTTDAAGQVVSKNTYDYSDPGSITFGSPGVDGPEVFSMAGGPTRDYDTMAPGPVESPVPSAAGPVGSTADAGSGEAAGVAQLNVGSHASAVDAAVALLDGLPGHDGHAATEGTSEPASASVTPAVVQGATDVPMSKPSSGSFHAGSGEPETLVALDTVGAPTRYRETDGLAPDPDQLALTGPTASSSLAEQAPHDAATRADQDDVGTPHQLGTGATERASESTVSNNAGAEDEPAGLDRDSQQLDNFFKLALVGSMVAGVVLTNRRR